MDNNLQYLYIDGDNIGLKIESSFLENNEAELIAISQEVHWIVQQTTQYLLSFNQRIIFSAADGIICVGFPIDLKGLIENIRAQTTKITFSIGCGNSLSDAYIGLRYAKATGKNIVVFYNGISYTTIK